MTSHSPQICIVTWGVMSLTNHHSGEVTMKVIIIYPGYWTTFVAIFFNPHGVM